MSEYREKVENAHDVAKELSSQVCESLRPAVYVAAFNAMLVDGKTPCAAIAEEFLHAWKRRALKAEACISIAINTCRDVTRLGRFSPAVDPVRWVEGLQAHLEIGDGDVE